MIWRVLAVGVFGAGVVAGATLPVGRPATAEAADPRAVEPDTAARSGVDLPLLPLLPPGVAASSSARSQEIVGLILRGVADADPVACELALLALDGRRFGGFGVRLDAEAAAPGGIPARELAAWVARPPGEPAAVPPLSDALRGDDPCARRAAARLLGRLPLEQATTVLLDAVRSTDPAVRAAAVIGLGLGRRAAAIPALRAALEDADSRVRAGAAWALGELEDRTSVPALIVALRRDADRRVRQAAAWALGSIG